MAEHGLIGINSEDMGDYYNDHLSEHKLTIQGKRVERSKPVSESHGIGTKIAEYIEIGAPTFCGNCEYVEPYSQTRGACDNKEVKRDPKVGKRPDGRGDVALAHGCCRFWEPIKAEPEVNSHDWRTREGVR